MSVNVKKKEKRKDTSPGLPASLLAWFHSKDISSACVVSLYYDSHGFRLRAHPLRDTHKNP